jgi:hypothetical protein
VIVIETVDVEELIDACDDEHEHALIESRDASVVICLSCHHSNTVEPDLTLIQIPAVSSMIYMQNGGKCRFEINATRSLRLSGHIMCHIHQENPRLSAIIWVKQVSLNSEWTYTRLRCG